MKCTSILLQMKTGLKKTTKRKSLGAINKFYKKRRYLFSKYDQGIKLDDESWYSVTPESIGEYLGEKVAQVSTTEEVNVIDAFAGCGGNIIQFGRFSNRVFGCEIDQTKIEYCQHNCKIYGVENYKVLLKDYLESNANDYDNKQINAVFLSPPWGGVGYTQMEKYKFEYMHPNFNDILTKSLEFTRNLILYIPRNTDVEEICSVLSIYASNISGEERMKEVVFEIERLGHYAGATSILVIYTGNLGNIQTHEIVDHLCEHYLNLPTDNKNAIKCMIELYAMLQIKGPSFFVDDVFIRKGQLKISAENLINKKVKELSTQELSTYKEICEDHLKSNNIEPIEEEKIDASDEAPKKQPWWIKKSDLK